MYKKNDFSREALRAAGVDVEKNGECVVKIYLGTRSGRSAHRKLHDIIKILSNQNYTYKKFPEIKTKQGNENESE